MSYDGCRNKAWFEPKYSVKKGVAAIIVISQYLDFNCKGNMYNQTSGFVTILYENSINKSSFYLVDCGAYEQRTYT